MRMIILVLVAGCASAPVGFGGTHKVTLANEEAITVEYDPLLGGYSKAVAAATAHCEGHGKSAVPTQRDDHGAIRHQTFECR